MYLTTALLVILSWMSSLVASDDRWVTTTDVSGSTIYLPDNRKPALYTENFGSCMENSPLTLDNFDASFFKDNMSLTFRFHGTTTLDHDDLMISLAVIAYGERRVAMVFNPCNANLYSLCPPERGKPVSVNGLVPLSEADIAVIPPIAMTIPDFEGQAIIQVFSNATRSQVACYSSTVTNGYTMAHPRAINSLLIFFTLIAFVSSTTLALLDADAPAIREHYAHSPSVVVTLSIFHHIFYSSAISVNWPRILVSFWSNFSWLAGMIRTDAMQRSISRATGSRARDLIKLNSSPAGFSGSMTGGYELREIYDLGPPPPNAKRNINEDFHIESSTIDKGFPLPGNYTGLPGALSIERIASANAFLTSFIWFLIIFAILIGSIYTTKFILELFVGTGVISEKRFPTFRRRWRLYTHAVLGRLLWCGFYMLIFSTTFQLSLNGRAGIVVLAVVVFLLISGCVFAIVYHAVIAALKDTEREKYSAGENIKFLLSNSWADLRFCGFTPINHDPEYLRKFGWLSARFRQERWWWFAATLAYEFLRGCILGGASDNPFGQIFVSLALEILMFAWSIWMKPYEATRLNVLAVYLLGFSKILTVGLSVAFHPRYSVPRITTTVIGVFIIIVQGLLTVAAIAIIISGIVCTHLSRRRRNASNRSAEALPQVSEDYLGRRYLTRVEEPLTQEGQKPSSVDITTKEETWTRSIHRSENDRLDADSMPAGA